MSSFAPGEGHPYQNEGHREFGNQKGCEGGCGKEAREKPESR